MMRSANPRFCTDNGHPNNPLTPYTEKCTRSRRAVTSQINSKAGFGTENGLPGKYQPCELDGGPNSPGLPSMQFLSISVRNHRRTSVKPEIFRLRLLGWIGHGFPFLAENHHFG